MEGLIFGILRYLILDWLWQTAFSLSCAVGNFEPVRSVRWSALRDGFEDTSNTREVNIHINVKWQTRICTTWPSFLITCRLLFIISTPEVVVSCNFFIHKNCFELFLSANFLYWEILNLKLTIAVCRIHEAETLFSPLRGCAGDRVKIVANVLCGTVLGDEFAAILKMRPPQQSYKAHWQPPRPGLPRNLKVAIGNYEVARESGTKFVPPNSSMMQFDTKVTVEGLFTMASALSLSSHSTQINRNK